MIANQQRTFHLGFPVDDLDAAQSFYGEFLNCDVHSISDESITIDFWGHQLVAHLVPDQAGSHGYRTVDGNEVPIPHHSAILEWDEWEALVDKVDSAPDVEFLIGPYVRDEDTPEEEGKLFIQDPAGNTLEFKTFKHENRYT